MTQTYKGYAQKDSATNKVLAADITEADPVVGAINGIVKGNGAGVISAAGSGTDYEAPGAVTAHAGLTTGVHGAGAGTIAVKSDIASDGNLSAAAQAVIAAGACDVDANLSAAAQAAIPYNYFRLTGDVTTTNKDNLQSITGMAFAIASGEVWEYDVYLRTGFNSTQGIKLGINGPSGATVYATVLGNTSGITAVSSDIISALNTATIAFNAYSGQTGVVWIHGIMACSTTPGTVQFQFMSGYTAKTATIGTNSYFVARKIA